MNNNVHVLLQNCLAVASSLEDAICRSEQVLHAVERSLQTVAWDPRLVQFMAPSTTAAAFPVLSAALPGTSLPTTAVATTAFVPPAATFAPLMWPNPALTPGFPHLQPPAVLPIAVATTRRADAAYGASRQSKQKRRRGGGGHAADAGATQKNKQPRLHDHSTRQHSHLRPDEPTDRSVPHTQQVDAPPAIVNTTNSSPPPGQTHNISSKGDAMHMSTDQPASPAKPAQAMLQEPVSSQGQQVSPRHSWDEAEVVDGQQHRQHADGADAAPVPQEATIRSYPLSGNQSSPSSATSSHSTGSVKIRRRAIVDDAQGPPRPGPQEAVVMSDSGALDDGETLTSDRLRKGGRLGNTTGLQVVTPAMSNGPALATVGPSSRQPSAALENRAGVWEQAVDREAMDTCSLEERAVILAKQLGIQTAHMVE